MLPDPQILFWGLIFSSLGLGYFIYGKRQQDKVVRYSGIALMLYPYVVTKLAPLIVVGVLLALAPKLVGRFVE
ncbi:MAG TPA: hypothetical protein DEA26_10540 [Oceanospirillales bacterium]|nr:hypothetical protein [Oceanospirillales bacterium]|tara:strand:- start:1803 stop:2021 length:219 start_codon:yes stop_codon:yes gene_type:complete